jgi:hypothetical protein
MEFLRSLYAINSLFVEGLYGLLSATLLYLVNALFLMVASPIGVPFIRKMPGKTSFGWRARLAYLTNCESIFREAYQNVRGHQV